MPKYTKIARGLAKNDWEAEARREAQEAVRTGQAVDEDISRANETTSSAIEAELRAELFAFNVRALSKWWWGRGGDQRRRR